MSFVWSKKDISGIPADDVVRVDRSTAVRMQWDLIHSWQPKRDVMCLLYGPLVLSAAAGISGIICTMFYRRKLSIREYGILTTFLPSVCVPAACAPFLHRMIISSDMIINPTCVVCSEVKAVMLQQVFGTLQPLLFAPAVSYMIANAKSTARLPSIYPDWRGFLKHHMKISKSFYRQTLPVLLGVNTILPIILTYWEYRNTFAFQEKIRKIERYGDSIEREALHKKQSI